MVKKFDKFEKTSERLKIKPRAFIIAASALGMTVSAYCLMTASLQASAAECVGFAIAWMAFAGTVIYCITTKKARI
jgi:hypothetical protein